MNDPTIETVYLVDPLLRSEADHALLVVSMREVLARLREPNGLRRAEGILRLLLCFHERRTSEAALQEADRRRRDQIDYVVRSAGADRG